MHVVVASKHVPIEARRRCRPAPRNAFRRRGVRPLALQAEGPGARGRSSDALWLYGRYAAPGTELRLRLLQVRARLLEPPADQRASASALQMHSRDARGHPFTLAVTLAVWRPLWYSFAGAALAPSAALAHLAHLAHPCTLAATLALRRLAGAKRAQTWQNRGALPGGAGEAGEAARSQPAQMQNRWVGTHRADR